MNSFRIVFPVMLTVFYGIWFFKQLAMRLAGNPYRPARPGRETRFLFVFVGPGKDISGFRLTRYGIIFISCNRCGGSSMYWQTVHRGRGAHLGCEDSGGTESLRKRRLECSRRYSDFPSEAGRETGTRTGANAIEKATSNGSGLCSLWGSNPGPQH